MENTPRFEFKSIVLKDWESHTIVDRKEGKILCHLLEDADSSKIIGERIAKSLNAYEILVTYLNEKIAYYSGGEEMKSINEHITDSHIAKELGSILKIITE